MQSGLGIRGGVHFIRDREDTVVAALPCRRDAAGGLPRLGIVSHRPLSSPANPVLRRRCRCRRRDLVCGQIPQIFVSDRRFSS